ncbi:hypothetical protein WA158_007150 [Blastocystis sp. Blastoise]
MKKQILLFGLSANPPTFIGGHLSIASYFSRIYDEVWMIPVYRHPYTSKRKLISFDERVDMLRFSIDDCKEIVNNNVKVSLIEKEAFEALFPGKSFDDPSISLIEYIYTKYPQEEYQFHLYCGTDTFLDILDGKWLNSKELMEIVIIDICMRKGYNESFPQLEDPYQYIHYYKGDTIVMDSTKHPIYIHCPELKEISSQTDVSSISPYISPQTLNYILNHHLYGFQ